MTKTSITIFIILLFTSCLRLDEQFFNREVITSYGLDNYTVERELAVMGQIQGRKINVSIIIIDSEFDLLPNLKI